jgi:hypothetical protein
MAHRPDSTLARARLSELYADNLKQLGPRDIVVASCGGAGQSLIGNILFEAGLNYVDAYTERLQADGTAVGVRTHAAYRDRLASLHDKDSEAGGPGAIRPWPRFVKSHHPPEIFDGLPVGGVWIIVRDPRDALYSLHQWRRSFGEEEWDKVPDEFEDWLRGPGDFSSNPVEDWSAFYQAWEEQAQGYDHATVLRFEDLKQRPVEVLEPALRELPVDVTADTLRAAAEASSFERMRAHEDAVVAQDAAGERQPRMIRKGAVSGWTSWMTPALAGYFSDPELGAVARQYGYDLPAPAGQAQSAG